MRVPAGLLFAAAAACGSGSSGINVDITATGLSLVNARVNPGDGVTFVNKDSRPHQIASAPTASYATCPELNLGAPIAPGSSASVYMAAATETCAFNDKLDPANASYQGTIAVAPGNRGGPPPRGY